MKFPKHNKKCLSCGSDDLSYYGSPPPKATYCNSCSSFPCYCSYCKLVFSTVSNPREVAAYCPSCRTHAVAYQQEQEW